MSYMAMICIPDLLQPSLALDAVLHRALIGPAILIPGRAASSDGGKLVPAYSRCITAAASLVERRLPEATWSMTRTPAADLVQLTCPNRGQLEAETARGSGALALSLMAMLALRLALTPEDQAHMFDWLARVAQDPEEIRRITLQV